MSNSKKQTFGINIGSSSMLMIFVTLCLISFAALSIVSANADKSLSEKIAVRTAAYYEACNSAEESLAGIDKLLQEQYAAAPDKDAYFEVVGPGISYEIAISETQALYVEISFLYPQTDEDTYYRITSWQVITP